MYDKILHKSTAYLYLCGLLDDIIMERKKLNRLKSVLADKDKTSKWLAEELGKDKTTISKWCTNVSQPDVESLIKISKLLNVGVEEILVTD